MKPKKSIQKLAVHSVVLSAILSFVLLILFIAIWGQHAFTSHLRDSSQEQSISMVNSLEALMKKGATKTDLQAYAKSLNLVNQNMEIHLETENFEKLDQVTVEQQGDFISVKHPIFMKQKCLVCHSNHSVGDQKALIVHKYPVSEIIFSFTDVLLLLVTFSTTAFIVMFLLTYFYLRKWVIMPLIDLSRFIDQVDSHEQLDILNKPSKIAEIENIRHAFNRLANMLSQSYLEIISESETDELTGLRNRRRLNEILSVEILKAEKGNFPFSLILLDLNKFKIINDQYGHHAGDEALKLFASVLQDTVRNSDYVFRMGGDEFLLILDHAASTVPEIVLEKITDKLSRKPLQVDTNKIYLSTSYGVAFFPNDGKTLDELLKIADTRMYQHKAMCHSVVILE